MPFGLPLKLLFSQQDDAENLVCVVVKRAEGTNQGFNHAKHSTY